MHDFEMPPNIDDDVKASITPIPKGEEPTKEEFEQAVEDLFQEIYYGHWRPKL